MIHKSLKITQLNRCPSSGNYNGSFNNVGSNANFWTSSENSGTNAYNRNFSTSASMDSNNNNKNNQYSVRLVKDSSSERLSSSDIFSLLYRSYLEARKNKRNTSSQLSFERNLESNLLSLSEELYNKTYKPNPSVCFINEKPVKREVIAADFRDRVVHHFLCNWLFPIFERKFIYDSYSCRKNKGTLFGINRARKFIKAESLNFSRECWILRLDISGFFMNIDQNILFETILKELNKDNWTGVQDKELCIFLIRTILFQNPIKNAIFKSPKSSWRNLPKNKSLINAPKGKGLPIGNLTSQLFGNIYLNSLDHFIKRVLKIKYYGRYVDDMILISSDKCKLLKSINEIRNFLKSTLLLNLHPSKVYLQRIENGFNFLGSYIVPNKMLVSKRLWNNFVDSCVSCASKKDFNLKIASYKGLFSHYNGINIK